MQAGFAFRLRLSTASALAIVLALTQIAPAGFPRLITPAHAQAPAQPQEQVDFDAALEGYGHWVEHPKLGDVWVPDNVPQDWQPYRIGHWVYTDEWGWYWNSDEDFGWVTYHYGRWYPDRELGWVWVPSDEWGPAYVNWRQGDDFVGWAPTPPDEYADDDEAYADNYMFVRAGDLMAPEVYTVFIPYRERRDHYHRSTLVNRTVIFADRRGAVNPGIPPAFIAHASGRPFHSSHIAPIVLAGTIGVAGAIILRNNFRDRSHTRISVRQSNRIIKPSDRFQRLPGLKKGERARLGDHAPHGAQGGKPLLLNTQTNGQGSSGKRHFTPNATPKVSPNVTPNSSQKIESKSIEKKRFEEKKTDTRQFEKKDLQQKSVPQNTVRPQIAPKIVPMDQGKQQRFERKNMERKSFEQKNTPNNNPTIQSKPGGNVQQNNNVQRQNMQQHNTAPKTQSPPPQRGRPNDKDKKN